MALLKGTGEDSDRCCTYLFPPQVWQLWGVPAREAEEGGVSLGLREARVWKGRAERKAKAKSNSESTKITFSLLLLYLFFFSLLLNLFSFTVADKRAHVISDVAQSPPTDTHRSLRMRQPQAPCHVPKHFSAERIHTKWVPEWFRRQALPLYLWVVYF